MLLKLIPANKEPTIFFSLSFSHLPSNINTPTAWANQLSHLLVEDLEVPNTIHSFDKAAAITSLLEEVVFDVERGEVRCRFVDGAMEEWGFFRFGGSPSGTEEESEETTNTGGFEAGEKEGRKLLAALDCIVRDVKASTREERSSLGEREEEEEGRQRQRGPSEVLERSKTAFSFYKGKMRHKKQRSAFMQFVSSIGSTIANLTSPSSSSPSHRCSTSMSMTSSFQTPESPSQHISGGSISSFTSTSQKARTLRRAARSALVDAYRRFVLTELVRRMPAFSCHVSLSTGTGAAAFANMYTGIYGGGFCVWILYSMRRRAQERIDQIIEEAEMVLAERAKDMIMVVPVTTTTAAGGGVVVTGSTDQVYDVDVDDDIDDEEEASVDWADGQRRMRLLQFETTPTSVVVPLRFNDDDDDETRTETDGSSLHTPSTSSTHISYYPVRPSTSLSCHSQVSSSSHETMTECTSPLVFGPSSSSKESETVTSCSASLSELPERRSGSPPLHEHEHEHETAIINTSIPIPPTPPPTTSTTRSSSTNNSSIHHNRLSQNLTGPTLREYNHLTDLRERLWQLAMFAESQARIASEEVKNRLEVLAVRSRRRAWSAGVRFCSHGNDHSGGGGGGWHSQYGLAMPFRSSPLARYSWTAEDLKRERERVDEFAAVTETETCLSTSSKSYMSVAGFPLYRRSEEGEGDGVSDDDDDDPRPLVEREFELYEEFPGPSPLDLRGRRRRRKKKELGLLSGGGGGGGGLGVGRLFTVSEELEGEGEEAVDMEFRVALGGAGVLSYGAAAAGATTTTTTTSAMMASSVASPFVSRIQRKERMMMTMRTFMGDDEDDDDDEVDGEGEEELERLEREERETLVDDDGLVDPRELDIELGFDVHQETAFLDKDEDLFDLDDEDDDEDDEEDEFKFDLSAQLERPKIRPRGRMDTGGSSGGRLFSFSKLKKSKPKAKSKKMASSLMNRIIPTTTTTTGTSILKPRMLVKKNMGSSSSAALSTTSPPSSPPLNHHPVVLDISRTSMPSVYCSDLTSSAEIGGRHLMRMLHRSKSVPTQPQPSVSVYDDNGDGVGIEGKQEEFTLAMDLPRVVGGGEGKKAWVQRRLTMMQFHRDGTLVSS